MQDVHRTNRPTRRRPPDTRARSTLGPLAGSLATLDAADRAPRRRPPPFRRLPRGARPGPPDGFAAPAGGPGTPASSSSATSPRRRARLLAGVRPAPSRPPPSRSSRPPWHCPCSPSPAGTSTASSARARRSSAGCSRAAPLAVALSPALWLRGGPGAQRLAVLGRRSPWPRVAQSPGSPGRAAAPARQRGRLADRVLALGLERSAPGSSRHPPRPGAGLRVVGTCVRQSTGASSRASRARATRGRPDALRTCHADTVLLASWSDVGEDDLRRLAWQLEGTGVRLLVAPAGRRGGPDPPAPPRRRRRAAAPVEEPEFTGVAPGGQGGARLRARRRGTARAVATAGRARRPGQGDVARAGALRQERVGRHGPSSGCTSSGPWRLGAEASSRLGQLNEHDGGPLFKIRDDPRVTRVGKVLRRWSLDELPQLLDVLAGSMSMVGPRPPLLSEVERYEDDVRRRLLVKPGITGLWQVSGRSDLSWEDTVRTDLSYVENWHLGLDLRNHRPHPARRRSLPLPPAAARGRTPLTGCARAAGRTHGRHRRGQVHRRPGRLARSAPWSWTPTSWPAGGRARHRGAGRCRRGVRSPACSPRTGPRPARPRPRWCSPTTPPAAASTRSCTPRIAALTALEVEAAPADAVVVHDVPLLVENGLARTTSWCWWWPPRRRSGSGAWWGTGAWSRTRPRAARRAGRGRRPPGRGGRAARQRRAAGRGARCGRRPVAGPAGAVRGEPAGGRRPHGPPAVLVDPDPTWPPRPGA